MAMRSRVRMAIAIAFTFTVLSGRLPGALSGQAPGGTPTQQPAAPAGNAEHGKTLFVNNGCYQCHNYEGNGGGAGARIAPNPPPFRGFVAYVRSPKGDMPPYKEKVLSEQDLADIYAYLRSRPRPPAVSSIPLLK